MKILLCSFFFLIYFSSIVFPQIDIKKLCGDWVKIKSESLDGLECKGKFGDSKEYLRLSFTEKNISFNQSPYDKGIDIPYQLDKDTIELPFHNVNSGLPNLPEPFYQIERLDEKELVLKTTFENRDIKYYYINQKYFQPKLVDSLYSFDNDTILIIRSPFLSTYSKTFFYNIVSNETYFQPRPLYNGMGNFGYYLSWNLKYNKELIKDQFSEPIKVSFIIDCKGKISNLQLINGFTDYYDKQILKLISKSSKDWIPNIIDKQDLYAKMIFTILILDKSK